MRDHPPEKIDRSPIDGADYYYIEFLGKPDGTTECSIQTYFAGFESRNPLIEIRKPRFVYADRFIELFKELDIPLLVVNTLEDGATFLGYGGAAVVLESIASKLFPWVLGAGRVVGAGTIGFISITKEHKDIANRVPSRKLRMKVLNRDASRCRICGRSPSSSVDIELHVHHIRPVCDGGATLKENLITLCAACHGGLDPHFDRSLFSLIEEDLDVVLDMRTRILAGQLHYRKNFVADLEKLGGRKK